MDHGLVKDVASIATHGPCTACASSTKAPEADIREDSDEFANGH
ncbi:hypothetical protein [Caballeronia udeis]|nr:hypothetical protein [Caballeronia udeis]